MTLIGELVAFGLARFVIFTLIAMVAWFLVWSIKAWINKPCHSWSHDEKFVKLEQYTNYKCTDHYDKHTEDEKLWAAVGTWICQREGCNAHGTRCFGNNAWWTIYNGQVIIDQKKMTDPGPYNTPKQHMNRIRAERDANKPIAPVDVIMEQMKVMEHRLLDKIERKLDEKKEEKPE